jgi:hypothetical protein
METIKRKVTYRLYPSEKQKNQMIEVLRLHQRLYNAALEQRIEAYSRRGISVTYNMQAKDLTQLRAEFPEYKALNAQSEQVTLKRLDRAFELFKESERVKQKRDSLDSKPLNGSRAGATQHMEMAGSFFRVKIMSTERSEYPVLACFKPGGVPDLLMKSVRAEILAYQKPWKSSEKMTNGMTRSHSKP